MNTPASRIRDLAAAGKITDSEADELLRAVSKRPRATAWSLFCDPFSVAGGGYAAAMGCAIAALGLVASQFGIRYDGFLDLHVTRAAVSLRLAVVEQLAAVLLPALLFWGFSVALTRRTSRLRIVDFIGMTGLARMPHVIIAPPVAFLGRSAMGLGPEARITPNLVAIAALSLGCLAWQLSWLYQGFENASGLPRKNLVAGMIGGIVVAEILSKIFITLAA